MQKMREINLRVRCASVVNVIPRIYRVSHNWLYKTYLVLKNNTEFVLIGVKVYLCIR